VHVQDALRPRPLVQVVDVLGAPGRAPDPSRARPDRLRGARGRECAAFGSAPRRLRRRRCRRRARPRGRLRTPPGVASFIGSNLAQMPVPALSRKVPSPLSAETPARSGQVSSSLALYHGQRGAAEQAGSPQPLSPSVMIRTREFRFAPFASVNASDPNRVAGDQLAYLVPSTQTPMHYHKTWTLDVVVRLWLTLTMSLKRQRACRKLRHQSPLPPEPALGQYSRRGTGTASSRRL
jgi:hypothetical protein